MSFEKLYEKYRNGTASEEEIAYVEEEIAKARKLGEILESSENGKGAILPCGKENEKSAANGILADADAEQVKKRGKTSSAFLCAYALYFAFIGGVGGVCCGGRDFRNGDRLGEKERENHGNAGKNDCVGVLFGELQFVGSDGRSLCERF